MKKMLPYKRYCSLRLYVTSLWFILSGFFGIVAAPPFSGTIFIDPNILTSEDPTAFISVKSIGNETRTMYDRRASGWITVEPHLFEAFFDDSFTIEMQVNPEFSFDSAARLVQRFAPVIGRLPAALRAEVETSWIHDGVEPFGGGNKNLLIHIGQAADGTSRPVHDINLAVFIFAILNDRLRIMLQESLFQAFTACNPFEVIPAKIFGNFKQKRL